MVASPSDGARVKNRPACVEHPACGEKDARRYRISPVRTAAAVGCRQRKTKTPKTVGSTKRQAELDYSRFERAVRADDPDSVLLQVA